MGLCLAHSYVNFVDILEASHDLWMQLFLSSHNSMFLSSSLCSPECFVNFKGVFRSQKFRPLVMGFSHLFSSHFHDGYFATWFLLDIMIPGLSDGSWVIWQLTKGCYDICRGLHCVNLG
uniref:Uncharacterized protein n=1 Tax=Opuntia streptacantha TaxID=393608 RepID=A0A7C9F1P3_OPUST